MNFFTVFGIISFSTIIGIIIGLLCLWFINRNKYTNKLEVIKRSNIVQYDEMGYPLRLVVVKNYKNETEQMWLDSNKQEGDVELKWKPCSEDYE